jgi:hypothetical protein
MSMSYYLTLRDGLAEKQLVVCADDTATPLLQKVFEQLDLLAIERRVITELGGTFLSLDTEGTQLFLAITEDTTIEDALALFGDLLLDPAAPVEIGTGGFGGAELDFLFLDVDQLRLLHDAVAYGLEAYGMWEIILEIRRLITRRNRKEQQKLSGDWLATGVVSRRLASAVGQRTHWQTTEVTKDFGIEPEDAGRLLKECGFLFNLETRLWQVDSD